MLVLSRRLRKLFAFFPPLQKDFYDNTTVKLVTIIVNWPSCVGFRPEKCEIRELSGATHVFAE